MKLDKEEPKQTYSRWDDTDPYKVLGLDSNATKKEIKKAYKDLSKIYHPDLTLTKKDKHLIIFQKINYNEPKNQDQQIKYFNFTSL